MKKVLVLVVGCFLMSAYVVEASPQKEDHGQLKFEQCQVMDLGVATPTPITCYNFTLPDVISVPEPCYTDVTICYIFVVPTLTPTQGITSRCNDPPFT